MEEQLVLLDAEDSYADPDRTVGNSEDVDEANEDLSHAVNELKEDNAEDSLELVINALAKMEEGTYGLCEVNGHPISQDRLEAYPEAPTCIEHAK